MGVEDTFNNTYSKVCNLDLMKRKTGTVLIMNTMHLNLDYSLSSTYKRYVFGLITSKVALEILMSHSSCETLPALW